MGRRLIRQDELFPIQSRADESKVRRNHSVIQCSIPSCESEDSVINGTQSGAFGCEILTRRFTRLGWYVGRVPGTHLCPKHNRNKRPERTILTIVQPEKIEVEEKQECAVAKPEMTFADRRIINAKLEEVYHDELNGYRAGWGDQQVADALGTNVAWVEQLRAQNFGPAEGNAEVSALKHELAEMGKQLDAFRSEGARLVEAYKQLAERVGKIAG